MGVGNNESKDIGFQNQFYLYFDFPSSRVGRARKTTNLIGLALYQHKRGKLYLYIARIKIYTYEMEYMDMFLTLELSVPLKLSQSLKNQTFCEFIHLDDQN